MKNTPGITNYYKTRKVETGNGPLDKLRKLMKIVDVRTDVSLIREGVVIDRLPNADTSYDEQNIIHDTIIHPNVQLILESIFDSRLNGQNYQILGIEPVTQGFQARDISSDSLDSLIRNRTTAYLEMIYKYAKQNKLDPKDVINQFVGQICLGIAIRTPLEGSPPLTEIEMVGESFKKHHLKDAKLWSDEVSIQSSYLPIDKNRLPCKEEVLKMQQSIISKVDFNSIYRINRFFL
jgi:hypothetical protein